MNNTNNQIILSIKDWVAINMSSTNFYITLAICLVVVYAIYCFRSKKFCGRHLRWMVPYEDDNVIGFRCPHKGCRVAWVDKKPKSFR